MDVNTQMLMNLGINVEVLSVAYRSWCILLISSILPWTCIFSKLVTRKSCIVSVNVFIVFHGTFLCLGWRTLVEQWKKYTSFDWMNACSLDKLPVEVVRTTSVQWINVDVEACSWTWRQSHSKHSWRFLGLFLPQIPNLTLWWPFFPTSFLVSVWACSV